jgi:hypothetical protein
MHLIFCLASSYPEVMREKREGREQPDCCQTTENNNTHANSMEASLFNSVVDTTIKHFWPLE